MNAMHTEELIDQTVQRFASLAVEQDKALLRGDVDEVNRLGKVMDSLEAELKARAGDQRRALVRLYSDPNPQVRLKAAKATLAVMPKVAVNVLRNVAESNELPQAGDAGMTLLGLERGWYKPS